MADKKMAILEIAPEFLREVFCLPDGAEIIDIYVPIDKRGVLEVKIVGAGWLTSEGALIIKTKGTQTQADHYIDWGFPLDETE